MKLTNFLEIRSWEPILCFLKKSVSTEIFRIVFWATKTWKQKKNFKRKQISKNQ